MTITLDTLVKRLQESIGDHLEFDTTTNITTNKSIISTTLNQYDGGVDGTFDDRWVYITEGNNDTIERKTGSTAYATSTGTLYVWGANLSAESGAVTVRLSRYPDSTYRLAINRAIEEIFPAIHRKVDNIDLITGNVLPPFNWATTSTLDFYTEPSGTLTKTTSTYIRNSETSAYLKASGANDSLYLSSVDYPRLLDQMDSTVDFKCWVYPEVLDDATLIIKTWQADGTTQTLTSTTSCPAGYWTLLELEDQDLNDDLSKIEFHLNVATDTKYVYFEPPRVIGRSVKEYLLPKDFQTGAVDQVYIQVGGYSDDACDDLRPDWRRVFNGRVFQDGAYKYLRLPGYGKNRRIGLVGTTPLESLSSYTDTITLDESGASDLLIAYAGYLLYEMTESPVSSEDITRYERESAKRYNKYLRLLSKFRMGTPSGTIRV